jgi:hypothetical protein
MSAPEREQTFVLGDGSTVVIGPGESCWLESHESHTAANRRDEPCCAIGVFILSAVIPSISYRDIRQKTLRNTVFWTVLF